MTLPSLHRAILKTAGDRVVEAVAVEEARGTGVGVQVLEDEAVRQSVLVAAEGVGGEVGIASMR